MAETPAYLKSKAAKYTLGIHRGPLPAEDLDPEDGAQHIEDAKAISLERTPSTRTEKAMKHWKRFWCCYCLANLIFLAIILPVLFCVIIPAAAQHVVDNSKLELVSARLMDPTPDSVMMDIKSAISLPIALPVRINTFQMSLLVRDLPGNNTYANVLIPKSLIDGRTFLPNADPPTPLNLPVWRQFVNNAMFQKTVMLSVHGSTMQHLGALHSVVTMDKDVPLQGLNNFEGFAINDTTLLLPPRDDGTNLIANATLPNPSPFTLEIGDTVFDVQSGDLVIGNATLDHLIIEQGTQEYPLHGILDIPKMFQNLSPILQQQKENIAKGYLMLKTVGRSVTYKGQTLDYYQEPLKSLVLPAKVPIGNLLMNTLHGMFNEDGENILANASGSDGLDLSGILGGSGGGGGGLLGSLKAAGGGGGGSGSRDSGGLLSSLQDSSKSLNSRGLKDMLDKPDDLFAEALSRHS